jgi:hypothetical protein
VAPVTKAAPSEERKTAAAATSFQGQENNRRQCTVSHIHVLIESRLDFVNPFELGVTKIS